MSALRLLRRHLRARGAYLQALAVLVLALRKLIGCVRLRRLEADLALGLDDPSATGLAAGAVGAVSGLARARHPGVRFRLHPVFGKRRLAAAGEVELALVPADLLRAGVQVLYAALRKRKLRRLAFGYAVRAVRSLFADA